MFYLVHSRIAYRADVMLSPPHDSNQLSPMMQSSVGSNIIILLIVVDNFCTKCIAEMQKF
jgi:hypothetical protein